MHDPETNGPGERPSPGGGRFEPPVALALFGFDDAGDGWLDRFRAVAASDALGAIGPYEILGEIDRGGQGVVYCARQPGTNRRIAVKRLRAGSLASAAARRRFEREIEIASGLSHPNIVNVFAVDVIDGQPTLAMEWVDGIRIDEWARGRLARAIIELFRRVCAAVRHAHGRGVIHRDLKPSNILVAEGDAGPEPRVLDFGLAKAGVAAEAADSVTDDFVGTLAYAAPEQIAGRPEVVDVRSDVYALGVVLYEMLTGRRPIPAEGSLADRLAAVRHEEPARPSSLNADLDGDVDAILLKALAKRPDERYASVEAFEADLARVLSGEPVRARARSRGYVLRKFVRRHRLACAAAAATLAIGLGFTVTLLVVVNVAVQARQQEAEERRVAELVSGFLQETLGLAGPWRGGGDLTVVELMREAASRAEAELAHEPQVAAAVYFTVGSTYANLWRWQEAVAHLERSLALYRAVHAGDHEDVARSLTVLGRALSNHGDPASVELQREGLAMRRRLHGDEHPLVAESHMRLGYALFRAAKPKQVEAAEAELDTALAMYRSTLGPRHRDVASCLHNYGFLRLTQRRAEDAEALYGEAIEILRALGDRRDPFYIEVMHGYTALLSITGRHEEAIEALDELVPLLREGFGATSVEVLHRRYAGAYEALGRHDEAGRALCRYLADRSRRQAADHPADAPALERVARGAEAGARDYPAGLDAPVIAGAAEEIEGESLRRQVQATLRRLARLLRAAGHARMADGLPAADKV